MADLYKNISNALSKMQISRAIYYLDVWNKTIAGQAIQNRSEQIAQITETYNLLLNYFVSNITDSQQSQMQQQLCRKCYDLADAMLYDSFNYYAATTEQKLSITEAANLTEEKLVLALQTIDQYKQIQTQELRTKFEDSLLQIFRYYWLKTNLSEQAQELFLQRIELDNDVMVQSLIVSALMLNILRNYSDSNILLLTKALTCRNQEVEIRVVIGLIIIIAQYYNRKETYQHLSHAIEMLTFDADIQNVVFLCLQSLLRTLETEKINAFMNKEIVPEILKNSPQDLLTDKFNIDDLEGNPKWKDYENGLTKKMIQISELQEEGADIAYNSFHQQKTHPFFKNVATWFLPFDPQWSNIAIMMQQKLPIEKLVTSNYLCDSDKYSFCIAFTLFSKNNQQDINSFFAQQMDQIDPEDKKEQKMTPNKTLKDKIDNYTRNIYRYYKLCPTAIADSTKEIINYSTTVIPLLVNDKNQQLQLANYLFKKAFYKPAYELYKVLQFDLPSAELFQKLGYSAEQQQLQDEALRYYMIADSYMPDDIWTLNRAAQCSVNSNQKDDFYKRILRIDENNKNALLGMAKELAQNKHYDEAIKIYYQLDYLYPDTLTIQRQLAFCALQKHDAETALKYWKKILLNSNNNNDLLNTAHTLFILGSRQEALNYYEQSWQQTEHKSDFWTLFRNDYPILLQNGVSKEDIHFMNELLISKLYVR